MTAAAVCDLLDYSLGRLGVSGISNDMKALLANDEQHAVERTGRRELPSLTQLRQQRGLVSQMLRPLPRCKFEPT
jgi:acetate kinase